MSRSAHPSAWRWFRGQGITTVGRVRLREATCPLGAVLELLPTDGALLDWGCGHGVVALLAAHRSPGLQATGCEIDGVKVAGATLAAAEAGLGRRVGFERVGPADRPEGSWDAVVLCDVLYLQAPPQQRDLVVAAAGALAPGGVLVCKEVGHRPRWKRWICRLQEQVSVRILRITRTGSGLSDFPDPDVVGSWMAGAGLEVEVRSIDRGFHVPHAAVVGRRPSAPDSGGGARGW